MCKSVAETGGQKSNQKIIELISVNPQITIKELTQKSGFSQSGIKKVIRKLKEKGVLKRIGPDKCGRWEIIQ